MLAELLMANPLDLGKVRQHLAHLYEGPGQEAAAELAQARRRVRFRGHLGLWQYQQAILSLLEAALQLAPPVRSAAAAGLREQRENAGGLAGRLSAAFDREGGE